MSQVSINIDYWLLYIVVSIDQNRSVLIKIGYRSVVKLEHEHNGAFSYGGHEASKSIKQNTKSNAHNIY